MLFKSRNKIHFISRVLAYIWPRSGWNRFIKYITLRIKRLPGSPHKIALGFSFGAMSSMTPFFGIHFLIGIFFSWLFRGSIAASIIGNLIGNPWTTRHISHGRPNRFVRVAPPLISPLCCRIRRFGSTANPM